MLDPDITQGVGHAPTSEPMAGKKRRTFPDDFKAEVVKRALIGKRDGTESVEAIARDIKVPANNIRNWIKLAPKRKNKKTRKARARVTNGVRIADHVVTDGKRLRLVPRATSAAPPTIDAAMAQVEAALQTLTAVRDAYRRVFGGG